MANPYKLRQYLEDKVKALKPKSTLIASTEEGKRILELDEAARKQLQLYYRTMASKSRKKTILYIIGFIIIYLFFVTVFGLSDVINKKGEHPIVNLLNTLPNYELKDIIAGIVTGGLLGYAGFGTFFLIAFIIFLILSWLDADILRVVDAKGNYIHDYIFSTFILTILSAMVSLIVMSFIYAYRN